MINKNNAFVFASSLFATLFIICLSTNSFSQTTGTTITLGGKAIHTVGKLPAVGTSVKDVTLTGVDLKEKAMADYKGKYIIMNIFHSVNTGVCSKSVRHFNEDAAG